ncbi:MAG: TIGR04282 family arsenosugar biosynthesis glycosyltransferase [Emcibacteraceae bacterium]|nr:TIGR04282 family arsenosugar biosynthesis glycosyltransferase [Emcibacteraceae bacterium]
MRQKHLIIFVKAPRMGRVKTRLARDIGNFKAWRFYRRTVTQLIKRVGTQGNQDKWKTTICVSPDDYATKNNGAFFDRRHDVIPQKGGDLGQRMQRVFDDFSDGEVVLIGGDIPSIEKKHITNAFDALRDSDITFGPATDGGYWMVGMRRSVRRISPFHEVRWSSEHALSDTVANIDPVNRISFTDLLSDVDEGRDL